MKKILDKKILIPILVVCLALLVVLGFVVLRPEQGDDTAQRQEDLAPDFLIYDLQGKEVQLSDLVGKPIVLNFWASWHAPCRMEMMAFQKMYSEYGKEVQFVLVSLIDGSRETVDTAKDFMKGMGFTFPIYFDKHYSAAEIFGVHSIPTTFFIDSEGYIVAQITGAVNETTLLEGINMLG